MSTGSQELTRHLLELQQQQLDAIGCGDYDAYATMCHPSLTCFEPEAKGNLVEGMVQLLGGEDSAVAAVVSYVRLVQVLDASGKHATTATQHGVFESSRPVCRGWAGAQETRVWERVKEPWSGQPWGEWVNVHLHRSPAA
ncbi:calcium/calmodulin dependent protein kinase II association-domain protein [Monoraphidium neglectum]|uniref:Calcium/calmodulin dependent protein kinase II association-domain protein n=1 Tax=Monoraphidium neglectum TaxID=145388 RepID=A0A0D2K809_9CHLO|nr:calcium/calmodulin dependent protein kinase II association-domain protein [Monoraphidium neglectum]KIZ06363.1 calcium/calmodulin dependent protein kinase II association-domain protein [Monoraphidium neglectum]|eukprot:XP_013905382.1 calcium/calmodulin dependent protein kinase II association-domain protein [Monoraphidium neglectum]